MSQREVLIVLAHALSCSTCRERMFEKPDAVFRGRALSSEEKESLSKLSSGDFVTAQLLARAMGIRVDELQAYSDHPVARLRHF
jgi:hypothetical protein